MERRDIEVKIERLQREIDGAKVQLVRLDRSCGHVWGEAVADHVYEQAHVIEGDVPGTMGVDWRGPCFVPDKMIHRWKRVCSKCGKVEYTSNTTVSQVVCPKF